MELWRRQVPCEIFQRVRGGRVPSYAKARESSEFGRLQEQLQEYRGELNKAYENYGRLAKAFEELREEAKDRDKTILDLKKQLKAQGSERRTATNQNARKNKPIPLSQQPLDKDQTVYEYIVKNSGTISIGRAARELQIPLEDLRSTIERLKKAGTIKQG
jgi:chromosome segregation ATPase